MAVELAPDLLNILACPNCHGSLAVDHDQDELVCTAPDCRLAYPVRDGIPVLLIDDARRPGRGAGASPPVSPDLNPPAQPPSDPAAPSETGN